MQFRRLLTALLSASLIMWTTTSANAAASQPQPGSAVAANTPKQCNKLLQRDRMRRYDNRYSIARRLTLLTWNIYKAQFAGLFHDLNKLNKQADLLFLQEATVNPRLVKLKPYRRFSPGYKSGNTQTGVMTLSRWPVTTHCTLTHQEPWLRTPKATDITAYVVAGNRRLLSINMHAINFTLGTEDYKKQLQDALEIMAQHRGPIIFAGDLNAWNDARQQLITNSLPKLGLSEVRYLDDKRTKIFGLALDQVWTRGISISDTVVRQYESSDHNPIIVTLELNEPEYSE